MWTRTAVLGALLLAGGAILGRPALAQQQTGSIQIMAPANGSTVNAPVTLQVEITGVTVKPAAEGDPQAFHYHALVDVDPATVVQAGQPIPTGQANIIHTADRSLPLPDLGPGQHTVTVILTRTDHVPLAPSVQQRVTFTVAAPGAAPAPAPAPAPQAAAAAPRVGRGGTLLADNRASLPVGLVLAGLLALGLAGAALRVRRR